MIYKIVHVTRYVDAETATLCYNQAHLTPRESALQFCKSCRLDISPSPAVVQNWTDALGNTATYFSIEQSHRELNVAVRSQVEVVGGSAPSDPPRYAWEDAVKRIESFPRDGQYDPTTLMCRDNRMVDGEAVRDYAAASLTPGRDLFDAVLELTGRIHADFQYDSSATSINTQPAEILRHRRGVCQDFARLEIACLRSLGISARYVSGYLVTQPPPDRPRLVGADATHAWASVYFPDHGWIDFDPTNNQLADDEYITLAWGRDYTDVSPIRGVFLGGGAHQMSVSVDVAPCSN
jgi:transglutaminase-like putative cysteine protease